MIDMKKLVVIIAILLCGIAASAQDKIVHPDISYAGTPRTCVIGGINVSGVEGYEDYMLTGISGLAVGQTVTVPGNDITEAVKRYWKHGMFSDVTIAADSLVGDKIYLHFYLKTNPRVSQINFIGVKKSEREDMQNKLGLVPGSQVTINGLSRAKILAKKYFDEKGFNYAMSILKSANGNPDSCQRYTFSYTNPIAGEGHFIHTYMGDGSPLPSFEGEPKLVGISGSIDEFTDMLWTSLNADNKVSLFVRYVNLEDSTEETRIVNKNK